MVVGRAKGPADPQQEKMLQGLPADTSGRKVLGVKGAVQTALEFFEKRFKQLGFRDDETVKIPVVQNGPYDLFVTLWQEAGGGAEINVAGHPAVVAQTSEIHSVVAGCVRVQQTTYGGLSRLDKPQERTVMEIPHGTVLALLLSNIFFKLENGIHRPWCRRELPGAGLEEMDQGIAGGGRNIVKAATGTAGNPLVHLTEDILQGRGGGAIMRARFNRCHGKSFYRIIWVFL
jgi:hypothetical protein